MKIYGWNRSLALCLLCILCVHSILLPARVLAFEGDWMDMGTDGIVTLRSQQAGDAGASSLQFTLLVNADAPQSVSVDFVQDGRLNAKVNESFWHADTGELNVYLAGSESLFDNGQSYNLTLGRVTATDSSGNPVQVELRIDSDSLRYVEGADLVQVEDLTVPAEPVVLNASSAGSSGTGSGNTGMTGAESGSGNASSTGTGAESGGGNASSAGTGAETGNTGSAAGRGTGSTAVTGSSGTGNVSGYPSGQTTVSDVAEAGCVNAERDLHARLQTVLNTAEKLQEGDYTSESYQTLREAIEWAEALLNAPDASREDVEDAILAIENAMGALILASDVAIEPVSANSTNSTPKEESAGGGFGIVLVIVIIAAAALGIGGIVSVQIRDKRNLL